MYTKRENMLFVVDICFVEFQVIVVVVVAVATVVGTSIYPVVVVVDHLRIIKVGNINTVIDHHIL